jgi:hypothetical protein
MRVEPAHEATRPVLSEPRLDPVVQARLAGLVLQDNASPDRSDIDLSLVAESSFQIVQCLDVLDALDDLSFVRVVSRLSSEERLQAHDLLPGSLVHSSPHRTEQPPRDGHVSAGFCRKVAKDRKERL